MGVLDIEMTGGPRQPLVDVFELAELVEKATSSECSRFLRVLIRAAEQEKAWDWRL